MFFTILVISLIPYSDFVVDEVEVIEKNIVMGAVDDKGRPQTTFVQWVFWDWSEKHRRYVCVDWKQVRKHDRAEPVPGGYRLRIMDNRKAREIRAISYRETWTSFDLEIDDRQRFPHELRRGLSKGLPRSQFQPRSSE